MVTYQFTGKITAGENAFGLQAADICARYGKKIMVVTYDFMKTGPVLKQLDSQFKARGLLSAVFPFVNKEPTPELVTGAVNFGRIFGADCVLAIGGGSVIDTAKAAAGLITNEGGIADYLEQVGTGKRMEKAPLPFIAAPTTAGTGAECTKNAVISDKKGMYKRSFRDERLYAREVILDPLLHLSTPQSVTLHSGMDALTQLIESFVSLKSTPFSESFSLNGLRYITSLQRTYDDGNDKEARMNMALAASMSGIALATGGLGLAHGLAAPLGIHCDIPHGLACALMLPHFIRVNKDAAQKKLSEAARILCDANGSDGDNVLMLIEYVKDLYGYFNLPMDLKAYNIDDEKLKAIVKDCSPSSMAGNPVQLSPRELTALLKELI